MVELKEVFETYEMVSHENLDVRTITMGISLLDCIDPDLDALCAKIHDKIVSKSFRLYECMDYFRPDQSHSYTAFYTAPAECCITRFRQLRAHRLLYPAVKKLCASDCVSFVTARTVCHSQPHKFIVS